MRDLLLITVDSLRYDHVGAYGYERNTTPFIDEMAEVGHVFDQAYAHAGATRASFPSILTSSYPLMYGGYERLSDERTLVSEPLREMGYRTGGFHSNLFLSSEAGYDRGFDRFYDSKTDPTITYKLRKLLRENLSSDGTIYQLLKWAFDKTEEKAGVELGSLYTKADDLTDMAINWIESDASKSPTFAWVHYMDVHHPYVPPAEHQLPFRDIPIDDKRAVKLRRKMLEESDELTEEEKADIIDLYDAEIRFTDAEIQRLVESAREELNDPIVLFTADHGEEFGEHGKFGHGYLHEECVHVPLIMDTGEGGTRYDELVGLLDVPPTLIDYADGDIPNNFRGSSLRNLVEGKEWNRTSVISGYGDVSGDYYHSVRETQWTYIEDEDGQRLYDRITDATEKQDVMGENPEIAKNLSNQLQNHVQNVKDTHSDVQNVDMEDEVVDRLEQLGYKME